MRGAATTSIRLALISLMVSLACPSLMAGGKDSHEDFLRQVADEMRALRQARALYNKLAPRREPTALELMLHEARLRRQVRALEVQEQAPRPPAKAEPAAPREDVLKAAQALAEADRQRERDLLADRVGRTITRARERIRDGRLAAAAGLLREALREDPRHREAARLLEQVTRDEADRHRRRLALERRTQRAESLRSMDQARIPYAATLTPAPDWAERSARRKAVAAPRVTKAAAERAAIDKALAKNASIDVIETPLTDVAAFLRGLTGVNFVVEKDGADTAVTLRLKDVSVRTILDWAVRQTDLAYAVRGGCVHIGPPSKVAEAPVVRIYDVADVLHVRRLLTRGHKMKRAIFGNGDEDDEGPFEEVKTKTLAELADELIDFLKEATGRKHWGEGPGKPNMAVHLGRLVVNAKPSIQEKVLKILENIRP